MIKKVTVIGSGTMGNGIAHHLALFDLQVKLMDADENRLEKARTTIEINLERQVKAAKITPEQKTKAWKQLVLTTDLKEACSSADLAIEAITESLDAKLDLIATINPWIKPEAILASNTSSISITQLAAQSARPENFIGLHFMNPVPVMQLVEIIKGNKTSDPTLRTITAFVERIHKTGIQSQDYPGFVANRILMPMINEAIYTLYEGVASAEAIDEVMQLGMAHPMGPLKLADFIGLDTCLSILRVLHNGFGNPKYAPCPLLVNLVNAGSLGRKTGQGFYRYD